MNNCLRKIEDLHNAVLDMQSMVPIKQGRGKSRTDRQAVIESRVAILDKILSDDLVQDVLEQCVIGFMSNHWKELEPTDIPSTASTIIQALLFSRLPSQKLDKYQTSHGAMHSEFRKSILLSIKLALQSDAPGYFLPPERTGIPIVTQHSTSESKNSTGIQSQNASTPSKDTILNRHMHQPAFLRPGYITPDHCERVRALRECKSPLERNRKP